MKFAPDIFSLLRDPGLTKDDLFFYYAEHIYQAVNRLTIQKISELEENEIVAKIFQDIWHNRGAIIEANHTVVLVQILLKNVCDVFYRVNLLKHIRALKCVYAGPAFVNIFSNYEGI